MKYKILFMVLFSGVLLSQSSLETRNAKTALEDDLIFPVQEDTTGGHAWKKMTAPALIAAMKDSTGATANTTFRNTVDTDGDDLIEGGGIDGEWVTLSGAIPSGDSLAVVIPAGYTSPEVVFIENSIWPISMVTVTADSLVGRVSDVGSGATINSRILIREQ